MAIQIDVHPTGENPINTTCMLPTPVHVHPTCFLWVVPVRGNLSWVIDQVEQGHCSWEKGLPTQSPARWLTDPWVRTQFLSRANLEAMGAKPSICQRQATRLIGPISPACDQYIQNLLTGTYPSVLNRHRRGLPHRNLRITTTLSPPFPSECSTGPPNWPFPVSILSDINHRFRGSSLKGAYGRHVVFQPLGHLP
jgi:hypothetical protein